MSRPVVFLLVVLGMGGLASWPQAVAETPADQPAAAAPTPADPEPRAIIERAVQALGGLERLDQVKAGRRLSLGWHASKKNSFLAETFFQSPDYLKIIHRSRDPDNPDLRILVLKGDKGWLQIDGLTQQLDGELLERFHRADHADRVTGLVALLRDRERRYTLHREKDSTVEGKPAWVVRVSSPGQKDITLYFDKASGLLVKAAQGWIEDQVDHEVLHEWYYRDYRWFDPLGEAEAVLHRAQVPVAGTALLSWLERRVPSAEQQQRWAEWLRELGSASYRRRERASQALRQASPEVAPLLRAAQSDPDREIARRAAQCLEQVLRQPQKEWLPPALRLLAAQQPPGSAEVLLRYLPWAPDDTVREEVQAALAAVARRGTEPALVQALNAANPLVRQAAAAALGKDGGAYLRRPGQRVMLKGLRYPGRLEFFRNGQREMSLEVLQLEIVNRWEERLFAPPEP
jgi:hypothetical protein